MNKSEFDFSKVFNLPSYELRVGIQTLENADSKGINLAELLYIMENGSPANKVPARPILAKTVEHVNSEMLDDICDDCINAYLQDFDETDVDRVVDQWCERIGSYATEKIMANDGTFVDNALSTIKRKGFNHPLFVHGTLAKAIRCEKVKL